MRPQMVLNRYGELTPACRCDGGFVHPQCCYGAREQGIFHKRCCGGPVTPPDKGAR